MSDQEKIAALRKWFNSTPHEMGKTQWLSLLRAVDLTETPTKK